MSKSKKKKRSQQTYRIRNWSEYDTALKNRGSLTFWLSSEVVGEWTHQQKTGKKGASPVYTDTAIWRSQIREAVRDDGHNTIIV